MDEVRPPIPADAEAALDALGLYALTDTPLGLELERLRVGEPWWAGRPIAAKTYGKKREHG